MSVKAEPRKQCACVGVNTHRLALQGLRGDSLRREARRRRSPLRWASVLLGRRRQPFQCEGIGHDPLQLLLNGQCLPAMGPEVTPQAWIQWLSSYHQRSHFLCSGPAMVILN